MVAVHIYDSLYPDPAITANQNMYVFKVCYFTFADGKLYDAYISYSWNEADREFVLNILLPYLEKFGYNVFIPEIHTIPSNGTFLIFI